MNYSTPSFIRIRDIIPGKPEISFLKNNFNSSPVGIKFDNISAGKFEALFINNNTSQHIVLNNHTETVDRPIVATPAEAMLRPEVMLQVVKDK